ncbi:MAG: PAS domain-containing sensor histidine kinase [Myxococcales bacterium]|nr:PAS domain-containing sensor histidine kinase [Myxococcales bacterium]
MAVEDKVFGIFFEYGAEAVFTMHRESRLIVSANRHLEELVGRSIHSIVNSPAGELFDCDERAGNWDDRIVARAGLHEDVRLRRLDGFPVFVSLTVAHIDEGNEPLVACIARDTTERRNLERDLIAKHTALYAAHAELGRTVEQLKDAQSSLEVRNRELAALGSQFAQAAQRAAIGEFSAGIAHSMNNPMAALSSALRQISRRLNHKATPELQEELSRFLQRSSGALGRMEIIVDAVRRAHKSGNLPSSAQAVNIADELRTALTLFEQRMESTSLVCVLEDIPEAWIPPDALHHVISNLIDNALRALDGQGTLRVHLHAEDSWIILDVEDNGPGLPQRVRENLFEPFVSGREDGTGLGLSMSFRLARQWRGDITHHDLHPGSRFRILMPAHDEHACACAGSDATTERAVE